MVISPRAPPAAAPARSQLELRSLRFFVERTVPQFTAFFPDELWRTVVLRLALAEPSIQHALASLAAYHERFLHSGSSAAQPGEAVFALRQYNAAIRELTTIPQSRSSVCTNMVAYLLFICIEVSVSTRAMRVYLSIIFRRPTAVR